VGYREIYEYIEARREVSVEKLCKQFDISLKSLLELLKPLIIAHKVNLDKNFVKVVHDSNEEIPE